MTNEELTMAILKSAEAIKKDIQPNELLDYITNLQQKIKKLENDKRGMLVQLYKANDEKDNYKSKCEKAIEYIKNNALFTETYDYDDEDNLIWNGATDEKESEELLNILQGSDK